MIWKKLPEPGETLKINTSQPRSEKESFMKLTINSAGYKDVYKKYTDQLIRVKVSDMANNDLEKYAKALDNAIMKYHGLKMEEVNDTMKHLWNKTYQGTDIDGIKIVSDADTAGKRSYNYRVVMTKDQVEMDMRGRCSAGQKMLASIIIRLALSDSFGQNCGILALDEPTNALDTENIDALAESLVDIINERKNHSNFQLIIITHDEGFLRKLGQSDVMEYYWRVSRDSRQKSVIERQHFR
ncbi:P-loop containing nucleoside triphosphate hydrolase protein [Panaeolus papilionaceus]|nr:P-loop containing nucleoside triphosphate hydrolase protein [Panaeolus papilionaceus]